MYANPKSRLLAPTDASTLQPSRLKSVENLADMGAEEFDDHRSQTSYATSVQDDNGGSILKPPRLQEITQVFPFECPYCWTIQDIKNERTWRSVRISHLSKCGTLMVSQ